MKRASVGVGEAVCNTDTLQSEVEANYTLKRVEKKICNLKLKLVSNLVGVRFLTVPVSDQTKKTWLFILQDLVREATAAILLN